jgi:DNA-directed RNA polymerase specialized sigma24 family protein
MVGEMVREMTDRSSIQPARELRPAPQYSELFDAWFSRSRGILRFLACRVLGSSDRAELAIHNCWLAASQDPPVFDREGAFRSWLVRVLITEALAIRHVATEDCGASPATQVSLRTSRRAN